jgi:glutamate-1-semialdehyde 2,1-aminomutase
MSKKNFTNSQALHEKALSSISGGVNSPVRSFQGVGGTPIFFESSLGPHLFDVDGNKYIDYVGSWGPMILGHSAETTQRHINFQVEKAISFGAPTKVEIELADKIISMVPSIERVRMMNSGTEATMTAVRLSRGYTGKNLIIKFEGCYHGHSDALLAKAGSGVLTLGISGSPGIPESVSRDTIVLPFNNLEAVKETFKRYSSEIACVIVEPVAGNMGCIPPVSGYLELLREITLENKCILVFDEVMTGFRLAPGGAQEIYDIRPDLTALGKIIGGGMPVGALGGTKEIMEYLAPAGPVYQAGTLSGNPLAMAAGLSVLNELDPSKYLYLNDQTNKLCDGLRDLFKKYSVETAINNVCGMLSIFFNSETVENYEIANNSNVSLYQRFFHGMLNNGVYLAPSPYEVAFLSLRHDDEVITATLSAAEDTLKQLKI